MSFTNKIMKYDTNESVFSFLVQLSVIFLVGILMKKWDILLTSKMMLYNF